MTTLHDVARAAGVSYQTVSRTINAPEIVLPSTREKVERAILATGYEPNVAARDLKKGKTRTLGLVLARSSDPLDLQHLASAAELAETMDWSVVLSMPRSEWSKEDSTRSVKARFNGHHVAVICLIDHRVGTASVLNTQAFSVPIIDFLTEGTEALALALEVNTPRYRQH